MNPADWIEQAHLLATMDRLRPKDVNLRRAVSAAYYGLFHFLIDRATEHLIGTAPNRWQLRSLTNRAFDHGEMAAASRSFTGGFGSLPESVRKRMQGLVVPQALREIAAAFALLQNQRHDADYDRHAVFTRGQVLRLIERARESIRIWDSIKEEPASELYLVALLAWRRMTSH